METGDSCLSHQCLMNRLTKTTLCTISICALTAVVSRFAGYYPRAWIHVIVIAVVFTAVWALIYGIYKQRDDEDEKQ